MTDTPPRVVMLGWGFPPKISGGLDTAVGELMGEFDGHDGVDVELVLPAEFAPTDRENIYPVDTGDGGVYERSMEMVETFVDRAADADVVHTHDWFGYGPGQEAAATHDVPWLCTFHSLTQDRNRDPPEREVTTEQRIVDEADHLVAVSEFTRARIREFYGGESAVVYNGFPSVDPTGRDLKAELGIDGEMLFFVGRHTDQKGISHLLYAMDRLPRDDVTLVVGGSGHLTDQLKRFVSLLGVGDRVEFVGYVPEAELADYYASADLFVSPSLAEPFGITVVEALSVGTHVVTTDCGAAEILPENCLVKIDPTSKSVASGIVRGLERTDPPEYDERSWTTVAEEYVDRYRDIATRR
jgi:glycosyltransferase involved in cell wall biosynthesis